MTKIFNSRRPHFYVSLTLSLLLVVAGVALPATASGQEPVGFKLRTADGGEISSEMLRGDVVVLAFGASWLPLSRAQVQGVQKLSDQYSDRSVRVYWVSTDSTSPKSKNYASDGQLRDFADKHGLKVGVLRDPDGGLLKRLRIDQLPAVVILDRQGNVSGTPIGGLDPNGNLADKIGRKLDGLLNAGN